MVSLNDSVQADYGNQGLFFVLSHLVSSKPPFHNILLFKISELETTKVTHLNTALEEVNCLRQYYETAFKVERLLCCS